MCPECLTTYHSECLSELGRCATLGCVHREPAPAPVRDAEGRRVEPGLARLRALSRRAPWVRVEGMQIVFPRAALIGQPWRTILLLLASGAVLAFLVTTLWRLIGLPLPWPLPLAALGVALGAGAAARASTARVVVSCGLEELRVGPRDGAKRRCGRDELAALAVEGRPPRFGSRPGAWRYRLRAVLRDGSSLALGPWLPRESELEAVGELVAAELRVQLRPNPGAHRLVLEREGKGGVEVRYVPHRAQPASR